MRLFLTLLLLFPLIASADPSATTRWLMNEPASLLDIGLLRAQLTLDDRDRTLNSFTWHKESEDLRIDSSIGYDYERDLIFVSIILTSADDPKSVCGTLIREYAATVLVYLEYWFKHSEYSTSSTPDDLISQLQKSVELRCRFFDSQGKQVGVGKRMFLGKEIAWTKPADEN